MSMNLVVMDGSSGTGINDVIYYNVTSAHTPAGTIQNDRQTEI